MLLTRLILPSFCIKTVIAAFSNASSNAVESLPVIKLVCTENFLYDYNTSFGNPKQTLDLRLDIANGLVWVPGAPYLDSCYDEEQNESSSATSSTDSPTSTSDDSSASSTGSSSVYSLYSILEELRNASAYGCSTGGVFHGNESEDFTFLSLDSNEDVTDAANATFFGAMYSDYIYVSGFWASDILKFSVENFTQYTNSEDSDKSVLKLVRRETKDKSSSSASTKSIGSATAKKSDTSSTLKASDSASKSLSSTSTSTSTSTLQVSFPNTKFVYANGTIVTVGSMGVGMGAVLTDKYNFLSGFVKQGLIGSNSYSLALNPSSSLDSLLIMGGIDTSKYDGNLSLYPFIPVLDESGVILNGTGAVSNILPVIPVTGYGVTSNSTGESLVFSSTYDDKMKKSAYPRPALLDSRTYYNYIPFSTLIEIAVELNAYYAKSLEAWLVDCSAGVSGTIDVYMGNMSISMNISSLLYPATDNNDTALYFLNGDQACLLSLLPDYDLGYSVLGTSFLRHAYIAVDNEGRELAIAQAAMYGETAEKKLQEEDNSSVSSLYAIESGLIPFAKNSNITSYNDLTMTIPKSINITGTISLESEVQISNGEVVVPTGNETKRTMINTDTSTSTAEASGYSTKNKNDGNMGYANNRMTLVATFFSILLAIL